MVGMTRIQRSLQGVLGPTLQHQFPKRMVSEESVTVLQQMGTIDLRSNFKLQQDVYEVCD